MKCKACGYETHLPLSNGSCPKCGYGSKAFELLEDVVTHYSEVFDLLYSMLEKEHKTKEFHKLIVIEGSKKIAKVREEIMRMVWG